MNNKVITYGLIKTHPSFCTHFIQFQYQYCCMQDINYGPPQSITVEIIEALIVDKQQNVFYSLPNPAKMWCELWGVPQKCITGDRSLLSTCYVEMLVGPIGLQMVHDQGMVQYAHTDVATAWQLENKSASKSKSCAQKLTERWDQYY